MQVAYTLFILLLFTLFTLFLGSVIISFSHIQIKHNIFRLFSAITIGHVSIVLIYSLIKSNFTSVNIVLIPIVIFLFIIHYHPKKDIKKTSIVEYFPINSIKYLFILSIASFLYMLLFSLDFQIFEIKSGFYDYHFYSELSRGLIRSGIESYYVRFYPLYVPDGNSLYHYYDLWLNAFISEYSQINTYTSLMLIIYPFFLSNTILGIISIIDYYQKEMSVFYKIINSLLFLTSFMFAPAILETKSIFMYHGYGVSPLNYMHFKVLFLYPMFLYAVHNFMQKNDYIGIVLLLAYSIFYNTLIVAIFPSVFILSLYYFFTKHQHRYNILFIYLIFISSFFIYKYYIVSDHFSSSREIIFLHSIRSSLIVFFETIFRSIFTHFLLIFFLLYIIIKRQRLFEFNLVPLLILFCTSIFSATLFLSIFHGTPDYPQALYNYLSPVSLSIFSAVCSILYNRKIIFILFLIAIPNTHKFLQSRNKYHIKYDHMYIQKCLSTIDSSGHIEKIIIYNKNNNSEWSYSYEEISKFISYSKNAVSAFNVYNDLNSKTDNINNMSPFLLWCNYRKIEANWASLMQFSKEHQIRYIFFQNLEAVPDDLIDLKYIKIICIDQYTKEVFAKINY